MVHAYLEELTGRERKMPENRTAKFKVVSDGGGHRFVFYCDLSDARVCTTQKIYHQNVRESLLAAWLAEGRECFNRCHKCGKWVMDAVYNAEVLECVECAPYESEPRFCKSCGAKLQIPVKRCPSCGKDLFYEGSVDQ